MQRAFEWDAAKALSNEVKHGVPFRFAARVFLDRSRVEIDAERPEDREIRRKAVGRVHGRLFTVIFTVRGDAIRIISARRASAREERRYEPVRS